MNWQVCAIYVLFSLFPGEYAKGSDPDKREIICRNLTAFHDLWESSAYGDDPGETETAAWILMNSYGNDEFVIWPPTKARGSATWRGSIPGHVIAQVHIHPRNFDPKPSKNDMRIAFRIKAPIYVISKDGIWSVNPKGHYKREAFLGWFEKMSKQCPHGKKSKVPSK